MNQRSIKLFTAIFFISGLAGLIYESIWTHYLKLFLGHAAYAQTLVLVIFLGGMALGSWLVGRQTTKISNLIAVYALVELGIGACALLFHRVFTLVTAFSYTHAFPALESSWSIHLFKWTIAAVIILPQSMLLGATFPLMSGGVLRLNSSAPGRTIAMLYFGNSLGAAFGVLLSGFWLIERVGLPGTIMFAGSINVVLACTVWLIARQKNILPLHRQRYAAPNMDDSKKAAVNLFLGVAAITGLSSFLYEIAWIRILSLVMGASTHSFELMLSAFITGLAIGGLLIQKWIDSNINLLRTLVIVQIIMGVFAALTIPFFQQLVELMAFFMSALNRSEEGFTFFHIASHLIASITMFPATICAGMTLPLITRYLIEKRFGESAIGHVYAANTVGSIAGVILGSQILMPILGVKSLVIFGATTDVLLGAFILLRYFPVWDKKMLTAIAFSLLIVMGCQIFSNIDYRYTASGVFRRGITGLNTSKSSDSLFHRDGKTATVDLIKTPSDYILLKTNGKTDASVSLSDKPPADMLTQVGCAIIPYAYHPEARNIAVIGIGSGITAHTLLESNEIERIDIIEIEEAMVTAARLIGPAAQNVFNDERAHIYIEDAKAHFTATKLKYDIIISEPSNPWVSGISGLFSQEFYRHLENYINENGIVMQWLQTYEMSTEMMLSVLKALGSSFPHYKVYYMEASSDAIIIASKKPISDHPADIFSQFPGIKAAGEPVGLNTTEQIEFHQVGTSRLYRLVARLSGVPANSDYFPYLDVHAVQARFTGATARELIQLSEKPLQLTRNLFHIDTVHLGTVMNNFGPRAIQHNNAIHFRNMILHHRTGTAAPQQVYARWMEWQLIHSDCPDERLLVSWFPSYMSTINDILPYLSREDLLKMCGTIVSARRFKDLPSAVQQIVQLHISTLERNGADMTRLADSILNSTDITRKHKQLRDDVTERLILGYIFQKKYHDAIAASLQREEVYQESLTTRILQEYAQSKLR